MGKKGKGIKNKREGEKKTKKGRSRKGSEKRNNNLHIKTIERYFGLGSIAKICLHYPKYHLRAEEKQISMTNREGKLFL